MRKNFFQQQPSDVPASISEVLLSVRRLLRVALSLGLNGGIGRTAWCDWIRRIGTGNQR